MAIQPLDLQVMFNQLDNVGKTQASQRESLAIQQTLQSLHIQEKTQADIQAVNESPDAGDGAEGVKDRGARSQAGSEQDGKQEKNKQSWEEERRLWDPSLGKNVDISG
ncbi:MAG: hypothetical protein LBE74_09655 [Treponema sp.]|jgi:hypothetical protein|nr:hypothetical protein [Treponema sp.]